MKFKDPIKRYYFGKQYNGCPIYYPRNYVPFGLTIRKGKPMVRRHNWRMFGEWFVGWGYPVAFRKVDLGWKDKYGTPRYEWAKQFAIYFFGLEFHIWWVAPCGDNHKYWEQWLWTYRYCDGDINKARNTWGWIDMDTNESSWDDKYLTN